MKTVYFVQSMFGLMPFGESENDAAQYAKNFNAAGIDAKVVTHVISVVATKTH